MQNTCSREHSVIGLSGAHPVLSFVRPSPDQNVQLNVRVTTASGNQSCDGVLHAVFPAQASAASTATSDWTFMNLTRPETSCADLRSIVIERADATPVVCWTWSVNGANNVPSVGSNALYAAQSTVDTSNAFSVQGVAVDMTTSVQAVQDALMNSLQQKLDVMKYAAANGITLIQASDALASASSDGALPSSSAVNASDALTALRDKLAQTVFGVSATGVTSPDDILDAMRGIVNQTEINRLLSAQLQSSNLNALVQAMLQQDNTNVLLDADAYNAQVGAPVMHFSQTLTSERYEQMVAVTAAKISAQPADMTCLLRLQEAAEDGLSLTAGITDRLRALSNSLKRQDTACKPAFHNLWMLGTGRSTQVRAQADGLVGPEVTHYGGTLCSWAGRFLIALVFILLWMCVLVGVYLCLRRLLVKCRTPSSRFYSPALIHSHIYQYILDQQVMQHAVYARHTAYHATGASTAMGVKAQATGLPAQHHAHLVLADNEFDATSTHMNLFTNDRHPLTHTITMRRR
jgi:hypothetical protein